MNKLSYALGLGIGRQLAQMGAEDLNIDDFSQAIKDILTGKEPQVSDQEAQKLVTTFFEEQEAKQRAAAAEKYKDNKEKGEAWLANRAAARSRQLPTQWSATTRVVSSTAPYSTAATSAARAPHSPSTALSQVGQKAFSS